MRKTGVNIYQLPSFTRILVAAEMADTQVVPNVIL